MDLSGAISDIILAGVSAALGAFIGYMLAARMYETRISKMQGRLEEQEDRIDKMLDRLGEKLGPN